MILSEHTRIIRCNCYAFEEDECWLWMKSRQESGYGKIFYKGKLWGSHRLSLFLCGEEVPENYADLHACHKCDNPPCCNPAHLFWGTQSENLQDATRKNRWRRKGPLNHQARLSEDDVRTIRARLLSESRPDIARDYGVVPETIRGIQTGRIWSHLK